MQFSKPTYKKPDSAEIAGLEYYDILVDSQKIGTLQKVVHKKGFSYALDILYNKYEFKQSEKNQIPAVIELEYSKMVLRVLGSFKDHEKASKACQIAKDKKVEIENKWFPKYKGKIKNNLTVKE